MGREANLVSNSGRNSNRQGGSVLLDRSDGLLKEVCDERALIRLVRKLDKQGLNFVGQSTGHKCLAISQLGKHQPQFRRGTAIVANNLFKL
ncbi:hypothetical protein [Novosphingobium sp. HII-3]|uniref:hypothetical protein n=1 Tax=Novosphingobium sp. HII-3 TaxID=2075565 RepID=UPI001E4B9068|nr:hypothetical protein [Novosphingobium sp. HII-3]